MTPTASPRDTSVPRVAGNSDGEASAPSGFYSSASGVHSGLHTDRGRGVRCDAPTTATSYAHHKRDRAFWLARVEQCQRNMDMQATKAALDRLRAATAANQ